MSEQVFKNGVNVTQLSNTIDQINYNPEVATYSFRTTSKWLTGTRSEAIVDEYYGALKTETPREREPMVFDMDETPDFLGEGRGASPEEVLLVALSGCFTKTLVTEAASRDISIQGLEARCEGQMDLRGTLGIAEGVSPGYQSIHLSLKIDAEIGDDRKEELVDFAKKHSVVYNSINKSVPINVELQK
jgi:uncharacterized OsmC-like protein